MVFYLFQWKCVQVILGYGVDNFCEKPVSIYNFEIFGVDNCKTIVAFTQIIQPCCDGDKGQRSGAILLIFEHFSSCATASKYQNFITIYTGSTGSTGSKFARNFNFVLRPLKF